MGYVSNLQENKTLVEEFNGGSWTILSSPNEPGAADSYLHGVSCRSESECTAVGTYINVKQDLDGTLVETWNGGFWSIRPSPDGSTYLNNLGSVSCYSRAFCAAVGQETPHHDSFGQTLAETTKTADWAVESSANVGTSANELDGVSCTSAELCRAVGQYFNVSEDRERPLVETWDGATWTVSPTRLFGSGLIGVSCQSARACTAVGEEGVIENWDGRSWSVVLTDRAIEDNRTLNAVSCDAPTICTAVGSYVDASDVDQTFIEQRGLAVTSVTPDKGPVVGDERIAVHGFELLDVNAIDFVPKSGGEAIPAKSFTCDSRRRLRRRDPRRQEPSPRQGDRPRDRHRRAHVERIELQGPGGQLHLRWTGRRPRGGEFRCPQGRQRDHDLGLGLQGCRLGLVRVPVAGRRRPDRGLQTASDS